MTGKGSGKHCERQAKGEHDRQGKQETRSVTGKGNDKQFERQVGGSIADKGTEVKGNGRKECGRKVE